MIGKRVEKQIKTLFLFVSIFFFIITLKNDKKNYTIVTENR